VAERENNLRECFRTLADYVATEQDTENVVALVIEIGWLLDVIERRSSELRAASPPEMYWRNGKI